MGAARAVMVLTHRSISLASGGGGGAVAPEGPPLRDGRGCGGHPHRFRATVAAVRSRAHRSAGGSAARRGNPQPEGWRRGSGRGRQREPPAPSDGEPGQAGGGSAEGSRGGKGGGRKGKAG